jgi:8-oxo-dGTP pyrophosphatase MutT (NUDIX family)
VPSSLIDADLETPRESASRRRGIKPPKSAAREAYEEAGIRGTVGTKSIGVFSYEKRLEENSGTVPCEVRVFSMFV